MRWPDLGCRTACYGPLEPQIWPLLRGLGFSAVEIKTPAADALNDVCAALRRADLRVAALHLSCYLTRDDYTEQVRAQREALLALQAPYALLTMRRETLPPPEAYDRIRRIADELPPGVVALLEVHADLATNAAVALETMRGVNDPRVRINYDPANIHFYNRGLDPIAEFRAMRAFVAGVHLKETNGAFETRHFPAIGEGVVDWAGLFGELDAMNFAGPVTLELEGVAGEEKSFELALNRLNESVRYIQLLHGARARSR
ncbi:MAG: sugar phosphate isomerase/epimerase [Phycisphaerales bacterium]|nr:sugar phosphate isomerase/epimerase [Phycisphaerales bacterium]